MIINCRHVKLLTLALLCSLAMDSLAVDLLQVYKLAEKNDQTYLQALTAYRATLESRPQAWSQLLPSINLSANTTQNEQNISSGGGGRAIGSSGEISFNSRGYSLSISQPLFRRDRLLALDQAGSKIKQAEAERSQAQQALIMRTAERYFAILARRDSLAFAQAEVTSLNRQLEQASQRFEVGLSAITDVHEAQAGYDLAIAEEIQALNAIDNAQESMRELTGEYLTAVKALGETILLVSPEPAAIERWTQLSLDQNPGIMAAIQAVEMAKKEVQRQAAGHFPTLDLVASDAYYSSGGRFGSTKQHATTVGLELNIPIYAGGRVSSYTREAHENYNISMYALEQARRSAQRLTRQAYLGVISGISRVKALKQAVVSSETALKATEAGFEVGTRTAVDVVVAQRAMSEARRNYSQARYDYILDTLSLKQAAGTLSPADLEIINTWLSN